jgi:hypothetical protein
MTMCKMQYLFANCGKSNCVHKVNMAVRKNSALRILLALDELLVFLPAWGVQVMMAFLLLNAPGTELTKLKVGSNEQLHVMFCLVVHRAIQNVQPQKLYPQMIDENFRS